MVKKMLFIPLALSGIMFSWMAEVCLADASAQFEQAETYETQGYYERAEEIYKTIVTDYPGTDNALKAQKKLTILYITWHKGLQAEAAFQELVTKFSENEHIANAVYDLAVRYNGLKKHRWAIKFYQYVLDNWPAAEFAVQAQGGLAKSNIILGKAEAAQAAVDKLIANFSGHPDLPEVLDGVAGRYRQSDKYEEAKSIYQQVIQRYPDSSYARRAQLDISRINVLSLIKLGEDAAAQAAIEKLLADFSEYEPVEHVADVVHAVAMHYRGLGKYEKAIEFYQYVIDNWPQIESAVWAQGGVAKSNIALGNEAAAQAAIEKLLTGFSGHKYEHIATNAVYDIAGQYRGLKKYEKAIKLYQSILDKWPQSKSAVESQKYIAISNILLGKMGAAQLAIDKLIANFSGQSDLPKALYAIARRYRWSEKYEEAESVYQQIAQQYSDSSQAKKAQLNVLRTKALFLIESGNDSEAKTVIDKLVADFFSHRALPEALHDIARVYKKSRKYEEAKNIYQQIIQQYPDSPYAGKARLDVPKINVLSLIESGDDDAVQAAAIDSLIADFNDHSYLSDAVFVIGEKYYNKAFEKKNEGLDEQAKDCFRKTIAVWERTITELPPSAAYTPRFYYITAVIYSQELGQYAKGIEYYQHIVDNWPDYQYAWHAQFFIGMYYERLRNSGGISESEANPKIEEAYQAVVEKYPGSKSAKDACLKLGQMSFKIGQWVEAAVYFELFLEKAPDDPRAHRVMYDLGRAYEKMGQLELAAQVYKEFINTAEPNAPLVERIKSRLEELEGANK